MKKLMILFSALMICFAPILFADGSESMTEQQILQCENYIASVESATDSNTAVTLVTPPYTTKAIYVQNTGSHEVWIDFDDDTATVGTDDEMRLDAGESRALVGFKTSKIGLICDTGESTEVLVEACR